MRAALAAQRGTELAAVRVVLPAGEHLAAQQPRVPRALVELLERGAVGGLGLVAEPGAQAHLGVDVGREPRHPELEGVEDAGHRLGEHRDPPVGVLRGLGQPVLDRLQHVDWQHAVQDAGLRDHEPLARDDAVGGEHGVEVGDELGAVGGRHAGQDDAESGAALPGVLQDLPHRRVRVPAGAGHEQPQVGRVEELVGEVVVRPHHGVDVGGVEERDALGHALAGGEHEQPVAARPGQPLLADARQRGQEHVLREPADVVGVAGEHRGVGGRPPDAGEAHLRADDAVHQRRLAGACRADERDQDRRRALADPRQQVVVDLAEQLGAFRLHVGGTREVKDQRNGGDPLPEVEQGSLKQPRVHPDPRLMPGAGHAWLIPGRCGLATTSWHQFLTGHLVFAHFVVRRRHGIDNIRVVRLV